MTVASSAGDVNGDGYGDILAAAISYDGAFVDEGRVWVFHGTASGMSQTPSTTLSGGQVDARFGEGLAGLGDVNGDGYSDIAVAAPGYDNGQSDEGRVYVYHGSSTGIVTTPARTLEIDEVNAAFGFPAAAGDVNADGFADLLVGCAWCDNGSSANTGRFFVYHGSATGIPATHARSVAWLLSQQRFGFSASGAGDVNGDGFSDILVGSDHMSSGEAGEGLVLVYHGSASGIPATAATGLQQNKVDAGFGLRVAGVGDTNGDGYSDVLISAGGPAAAWNERVFLYRGSST